MLLITYDCNLRCSYCYEPKRKKVKMSLDQAKRHVRDTVLTLPKNYSSFDIQFMGGEPLLEFTIIKDLSEWLWNVKWPVKLGMLFAVTNGTLLDNEMRAWFNLNKSKIALGLSFDGNHVMQNINRSKSAAFVDLEFFAKTWPRQTVKMTLSPKTLPFLSEGVSFLHKTGFQIITADLATGSSIGWGEKDLRILKQQLSVLSDFYLFHPLLEPFSMLKINIFNVGNHSPHRNCACGKDLICFDPDGHSYPCHLFAPITCGEERAAASLNIDFSGNDVYRESKCLTCSLVNLCPHCYGANYNTSGDITRQDYFTCCAFKLIYIMNCQFQYKKAIENSNDKLANKIYVLIKNITNTIE